MAYAPSAYQSPVYDEKKYRNNIDTSYYTNAVNQYAQEQEQNRARQIGEAQKTQQTNLKNAYINRLQNEQKLNQKLAMSGIRGGMTETANLNLANQYGQARANINSTYANSVNSINRSIDQNIRDYRADIASQQEQYLQNIAQARWQAAREDALNKYNAAREDEINKINRKREDEANKYERKQAEIARQTEYWSTYYTNYYSGYSKKNAQKAVKTLQAKLKKAKTQYEKIRLQQAISGAKARLGVIATTK